MVVSYQQLRVLIFMEAIGHSLTYIVLIYNFNTCKFARDLDI